MIVRIPLFLSALASGLLLAGADIQLIETTVFKAGEDGYHTFSNTRVRGIEEGHSTGVLRGAQELAERYRRHRPGLEAQLQQWQELDEAASDCRPWSGHHRKSMSGGGPQNRNRMATAYREPRQYRREADPVGRGHPDGVVDQQQG
jgi:hypothetical protein